MKFLNSLFVMITVMVMSMLAWAQESTEVLPVPVPDVSDANFLEAILSALGGMSGLKAIGIAVVVLQLIFKFIGTTKGKALLMKVSGKTKFIIVGLLSLGTLILVQMNAGVTFSAAILNSSVVTALMNYGYKFYEVFIEKKKK